MKQGMIERIERRAGVPDLVDILATRLKASELSTLLLAVYDHRAERRTPAEVLADYQQDRFVAPSAADPEVLAAWEELFFRHLNPGFERLVLSPLAPWQLRPRSLRSVRSGRYPPFGARKSPRMSPISLLWNVPPVAVALRSMSILPPINGKSEPNATTIPGCSLTF